jgi:UDP-N-acetyl-D-glucosamine dehydrogenase
MCYSMWNLNMIKKVAILGLGYIGLPTLVAIAKTKKYDVIGYDVDEKKIKKIKKGISPIEDKTVERFITKNKINVSTNSSTLKATDVFIICVPTPVHNDYVPNYTYIIYAIEKILPYLKKNCHIVLESTVNPGTCKEIILPILEKNKKLKVGIDYNLSHCPERINPGDKKWNIYNINRNIGSITIEFNKNIAKFYRSFITKAKIYEVSSLEIAEASKIVENTFRDINIAYVNELAKSFDAMGIDLHETLQAASNKPFAFMAHWPGCGVGGHCIGVDPYYLIKKAANSGFDHKFLKLARDINNSMTKYTVDKLILGLNELQLPIKGTPITLLGLTFKPNVSDTRESPSWEIKKELEKLGADLTIYDPYVETECKTLKQSIQRATAIVIATAHREFIEKLPSLIPKSNIKLILDGRNCLDKSNLGKNIIYRGIGR